MLTEIEPLGVAFIEAMVAVFPIAVIIGLVWLGARAVRRRWRA